MDSRKLARDVVDRCRYEVMQVVADVIRIPAQNKPPVGEEKAVQEYLASYLANAGMAVDLYQPDLVPGLREHPEFWPGRDYRDRPNLSSRLKGQGGGRSLLLTGHSDTVAVGENVWNHPPFGAHIKDGKLYGLGASDMKGQMAAMLVLYKTIAEHGISLRGDLAYESVVDEEEGGVNATIAGRLRDGVLDGAILPEATGLEIYPAVRGALILGIYFGGSGTWLDVGKREKQSDAITQLGLFLSHLGELRELRRRHPVPHIYQVYPDPVPVQVTKVYAGGWGSEVPIAVPNEARVELIAQTLPGEEKEACWREFNEWLDSLVGRHADVFPLRPRVEYKLRWMHPSQTDPAHTLVTTLLDCATQVMGQPPAIKGAPYSCDLWALQRTFGMPAVVFGPRGGNSHAADEYVEVESIFAFLETLALFIFEWCGVTE
jgi:acetylornithine deacetylase